MRVLVVEDERTMADAIARGLRREGLAVDVAYDGSIGHEMAMVTRYDVVVLDRDLPGVHGDKICADLVASGALTRVLMLTASGTVADRVEGLQLGADDYLPKPFAFDELVARVRALGRRATPAAPPVLVAADVVLDQTQRTVTRAGEPLDLTRKEFGILEELLKARGGVVSSEELLERVWDANTDPFTTTVRVTMMTLRKKLGDPPLIETVVGVGYRVPARARLGRPPSEPVTAMTYDARRRPALVPADAAAATDAAQRGPAGGRRAGAGVAGLVPGGGRARLGAAAAQATGWSTPTGPTSTRPAGRPAALLGRGELLLEGLLAVFAVSVIGVAGAYVVAGRALRPLQQVTSTAQHLTGDTLDQRIRYVGADDEVAELAATFDAMLDRINITFETQKRFVANASHELRTPLAVMRTEVDVTLADPDADLAEYRRMAKVVRDGSDRANALVDALLVLARSEAQAGRRLSKKVPSDLSSGVSSALSAMRKEADRIHLEIDTDLEPAPVVGDPGLLDRLAGNLLENAVRYNHLHGQIWVRTGGDAEHSWLVVKNTGFEVEPADVPGLFEPFRRGGRERTGGRGSGLGLSIVRAVAEAHGGTVTAAANPDGGLEVTVTLPSAATTPVVTASAAVPTTTS